MRICLDLRMVGEKVSGIPRCAYSLAKELARLAPEETFLVLARGNALERLRSFPNVEVIQTGCPAYSLREQFVIPRRLRELAPDLYHSLTYAAPVRQPCKTLMTIYDLIPMRLADEYRLRHRVYYPLVVRRAARRAERILTISECSKRDIVELLDVDPVKVCVIPCGIDPVFLDPASRPAPAEKPYLLALGNEKPHKDMAPTVEVFERVGASRDLDLILVGRLSDRVRKRLQTSPFANRIRVERDVSDERLAALYAGAEVFLFPSRYEGFGLPPLEAMACGAPAVVYDAAAVVEACGKTAMRVPVGDVDALTQAVERLLDNAALREEVVAAGRERARAYTWPEAARHTLALYREVLA